MFENKNKDTNEFQIKKKTEEEVKDVQEKKIEIDEQNGPGFCTTHENEVIWGYCINCDIWLCVICKKSH